MSWLPLAELLLHPLTGRAVALAPALDHAQLQQRALRLAGALQARGVQRVALYLEDAGELAIALLGAWRAGVTVLLPTDAGRLRARLHALGAIRDEDHDADDWRLRVDLPLADAARLAAQPDGGPLRLLLPATEPDLPVESCA